MMSNQSESAASLRANTALPNQFFAQSGDHIWIFGEDRQVVAKAVQKATRRIVLSTEPMHEHRGFLAWRLQKPANPDVAVADFTLILAPFGTGAVEALFYEALIAKPGLVKRIVLVGTAGIACPEQPWLESENKLGKIYVINEAYPVGCGLSVDLKDLPLRPYIESLELRQRLDHLPGSSVISTDRYYGCSPIGRHPFIDAMIESDPNLRRGMDDHWKAWRLLDMETVMLYHLGHLYNRLAREPYSPIEFVALRAVANSAGKWEEQAEFQDAGLASAITEAVKFIS